MTTTATLTWNDAVDQAFVPTDLDRYFAEKGLFHGERERHQIVDDKLTDFSLIRERAAMAYIAAHEGEEAEVEYVNTEAEQVGGRWVFRAKGVLRKQYLHVPVFTDQPNVGKSWDGFVVGSTVVPLNAVTRIAVAGDNSVIVL